MQLGRGTMVGGNARKGVAFLSAATSPLFGLASVLAQVGLGCA